jgi:solute carrier family 40 (iron-regulated transporter), member 1
MKFNPNQMSAHHGMTSKQAYTLYLCHALSTWNARSYEFAAVLFTTAAYPGGLKAASLIGISNSLATISFASAIGRWIDTGASRLRTLLATIFVNRLSVIGACIFWFLIVSETSFSSPSTSEASTPEDGATGDSILSGTMKSVAFAVLLGLGIIENLSRKANIISIERDWVPVLSPTSVAEKYTLTQVNATMARIDIACKLLAPLVMSWFFSVVPSIKLGVAAVVFSSVASLALEWLTSNMLWNMCPVLQEPKALDELSQRESQPREGHHGDHYPKQYQSLASKVLSQFSCFKTSVREYFNSSVWRPSLAMCMTHTSILSVTSVTVVFLLNSGYSLRLITIAEGANAVFELSSTILVPMAVKKLASSAKPHGRTYQLVDQDERSNDINDRHREDDKSDSNVDAAIRKVGFWGICGMVLILLPTPLILIYLTSHLPYPIPKSSSNTTFYSYTFLSIILFFCLCASRLGRGTFALVTQQLAQSHVPSDRRSSFAGTEQSFVSIFGLLHSLGTAIWSQPNQFGWLAIGSYVGLSLCATLYISWFRKHI